MLNIKKEDGFFRKGFGIKYILIWDDVFNKRLGKDGPALFCKAPPAYLVHVEMDSNNNIESKDIHIHYSTHNASNIVDRIMARIQEIVELCKTSVKLVFVLDVLNMKIIERSDFTFYKPINGLNSLFILQEQEEEPYYMLVNPTAFAKEDIFSIFIAHIYSSMICLPPLSTIPRLYSKQFMQLISSMMYRREANIDFKVGDKELLDNVNFNSINQIHMMPLGKTERLHILTMASKEQERKDLLKKTKQTGGKSAG
jgi:hypothetical protein